MSQEHNASDKSPRKWRRPTYFFIGVLLGAALFMATLFYFPDELLLDEFTGRVYWIAALVCTFTGLLVVFVFDMTSAYKGPATKRRRFPLWAFGLLPGIGMLLVAFLVMPEGVTDQAYWIATAVCLVTGLAVGWLIDLVAQ